MDQQALFSLTYGLFVLTARADGRDSGCIINTVEQVTENPNRITMAVNQGSFTHDLVQSSGQFNVSILSEEASFDLFRRFGFQSGRTVDKFSGFPCCKRGDNGIYYITKGVNSCLSARVEQAIDLGSHTLFIAHVEDMKVLSDAPSATYAYYHAHIKPRPEKAKAGGRPAWRCKICGYIYEGEDLPEDYICPLCRHPASDFERITL